MQREARKKQAKKCLAKERTTHFIRYDYVEANKTSSEKLCISLQRLKNPRF